MRVLAELGENFDSWTLVACALALVLIVAGARGRRSLSVLERVGSLALRAGVMALALIGLWQLSGFDSSDAASSAAPTSTPRSIVLVDSDALEGAPSSVRDTLTSLKHSLGGQALWREVRGADALSAEFATLQAEMSSVDELYVASQRTTLNQIKPALNEISQRVVLLPLPDVEEKGLENVAHGANDETDDWEATPTQIDVLSPVSIVAGDALDVTVRNASQRPNITLIDGEVRREPDTLQPLGGSIWAARWQRIEASTSEARQLTLHVSTGDERWAHRSVQVLPPEEVFVLTSRAHIALTWQRLLSGFRVRGLQTGVAPGEPWDFSQARAVVMPLDEEQIVDQPLTDALRDYVSGGGLLFTTGMSESYRRAHDLPEGITSLLPAMIPALPPLPKPDDKPKESPPIKEESGLLRVPKVSALFLIDHSGSMLVANRWKHCKTAVNLAFESVQDYDRVGLATFNDKLAWDERGGITKVDSRIRSQVRRYLDDHPPSEPNQGATNTNIYQSVSSALEALEGEPSAIKLLVVVSDGHELGPGVKHVEDHMALRERALRSNIIIATVRVGAGQEAILERMANNVMSAMATAREYATAIEDAGSESVFPKIMLSFVNLAYTAYETQRKARESTTPETPDDPDAKPETPDPNNPLMLEGGFLPSTQRALATALLPVSEGTLPGWRQGYAAITLRPDADNLLVALPIDNPGRSGPPVLARRAFGLGQVLLLAPPLDHAHSPDWLRLPDESGALLDRLVRDHGRSRLAERAPVLSFSREGNCLLVRPGNMRLNELSIMVERDSIAPVTLALAENGKALLPDGLPVQSITLLGKGETPIASMAFSALPEASTEPAAPTHLPDADWSPIMREALHTAPKLPVAESAPRSAFPGWFGALLAFGCCGLVLERWLRRA